MSAPCAPTPGYTDATLDVLLVGPTGTVVQHSWATAPGPTIHVSIDVPADASPGTYTITASCEDYPSLTVFAPATFTVVGPGGTGIVLSKIADAPRAVADTADGYTVTITNLGATAVTVADVTDTLPAEFRYTTGSTSGGTAADPIISGRSLHWTGPFAVAAHGTFHFHFEVTVAHDAGHYTNSVTATATDSTPVAPANDTAPIDVADVRHVSAFPIEGVPVAVAIVLAAGWLLWRRSRNRPAINTYDNTRG